MVNIRIIYVLPTLEPYVVMTHSSFGFMTNCVDNRWQDAGG